MVHRPSFCLGCAMALSLAIVSAGVIYTAGAAHAAQPAADVIVLRLEPMPLANPNAVLCTNDPKSLRVHNNAVFSLREWLLEFRAGASPRTLLVGGTKITILLNDEQFELRWDGGSATLQKNGAAFKPVTVPIGKDRQYILAFPYGYIRQNTTAARQTPQTQGVLSFRSGSVQQFQVDGQTFALFDQNLDGYYHTADDRIGTGPADQPVSAFVPISKLLATAKGVYEIRRLAEDGSQIELVPHAGQTAKLTVGFDPPDLVFGSAWSSRDASMSLAGAADAGSPATFAVVPGHYVLRAGLLYSTKLNRIVALTSPGRFAPVAAQVGRDQTVQLGAPFVLEAKATRVGNRPNIKPESVRILGRCGEEYTNVKWIEPPEVSLVAGDRTIPLGKMAFG